MTRMILATAFLVGCNASTETVEVEETVGTIDQRVYDFEGGYQGDFSSANGVDPHGYEGKDVTMVVKVVQAHGESAHLDMSVRAGMNWWMVGAGSLVLQSENTGAFEAEVSDGQDSHCMLEGDWIRGEGLVSATVVCWNNAGTEADYEFTLGRF